MSEQQQENMLTETERQKQVEAAMEALHQFVLSLSEKADKTAEYGEELWGRIQKSLGVLKELAYFHDTGEFWGQYKVAGYSIMDILIWQVDHFKAYMDRHEDMNRWRRERLFLESMDIFLQMEENPEPFIKKMQDESGTDFDQKY